MFDRQLRLSLRLIAMDERTRCLFCFEAAGVQQVCFCKAACHIGCLAKLVAGQCKTACPICRRPLRPDVLTECFAHAHNLNVRSLGASHPDSKLSQLNLASSLALAGRSEDALRELAELRSGAGRVDECLRIVSDIEYSNVLAESGRPHEAIPILHDIVAKISFTGSCPTRRYFWLQAMLGMGCALLQVGLFDRAKAFFEMSLQSSRQMESAPPHQRLPFEKILRGLAACLEAEGKFEKAVDCLRVLAQKHTRRHSDSVTRADLHVEWCTLEIRCGRNNASTLARLQEATRVARQAAKMGDHRAPSLLDEALGALSEVVPQRVARRRLRRKTHLEDLELP